MSKRGGDGRISMLAGETAISVIFDVGVIFTTMLIFSRRFEQSFCYSTLFVDVPVEQRSVWEWAVKPFHIALAFPVHLQKTDDATVGKARQFPGKTGKGLHVNHICPEAQKQKCGWPTAMPCWKMCWAAQFQIVADQIEILVLSLDRRSRKTAVTLLFSTEDGD